MGTMPTFVRYGAWAPLRGYKRECAATGPARSGTDGRSVIVTFAMLFRLAEELAELLE